MTTIEPIASSSAGNAYRWGDLLLEAGLPARDLLRAFGRKPAAAVITHEHYDHAIGVRDLLRLGIPIIASAGTIEALELPSRAHLIRIRSGETVQVAGYQIHAIDAIHDAREPLSYIIAHGDERLLFATDTAEIPYKINGLTELAVEANYSRRILEESRIEMAAKIRTSRSHMSIETLVDTLRGWDLRTVERITLLHLSDRHSNADEFRKTIEAETGKPAIVAPKNRRRRT